LNIVKVQITGSDENRYTSTNISKTILDQVFSQENVLNDLKKKFTFHEKEALMWVSFNYEVLRNEILYILNRPGESLDEFSIYQCYEDELECFVVNMITFKGQK